MPKLLLCLLLLANLFYRIRGFDATEQSHVWLGVLIGLAGMQVFESLGKLLWTFVSREKHEVPREELGKLENDRL